MTRKCVLCKETNYRNSNSFFSAPKDPEIRKKWQDAIAIENYTVTDDTYVCSKHFHKGDIITHWVSGVPPHVITIKYKKCRLRPGAVPDRHYYLETPHFEDNASDQMHSVDSNLCINNILTIKLEKPDVEEENHAGLLIPKTEEGVQINNNENHNVSSLHQYGFNGVGCIRIKSENDWDPFNDISEVNESVEQDINQGKQNKGIDLTEDSTISDRHSIEDANSKEKREKQNQSSKKDINSDTQQKSLESSSKRCNTSEEDEITAWKTKVIKKEASTNNPTDDSLKARENVHIDNQIVKSVNYNQLISYYPACNDVSENELLFEDLLEVCTEVLLPRGWSCLVTSKGYTTTIVYLYMGLSKSGIPYTEKQVYIKSDMILHCAAINRLINPLFHNLIKEGKHLKLQSLLDLEEVIDEFDQRAICQGIYNLVGFGDISRVKIAYKDGVKWRHVLCPLVLKNDSVRCTKCNSLSKTLQRKWKKLPAVLPHNPSILTKEQQNVQSIC